MARYRKNATLRDIVRSHPTSGLPLWRDAVAGNAPRSVATGSDASAESYHTRLERGLNWGQARVLEAFLKFGPATDRQIMKETGLAINVITGRRNELMDLGLIERCGKTWDEETQSTVTLWRSK